MDPYTHLIFCFEVSPWRSDLLFCALAGSIAPDAGYFSKSGFSDKVHEIPRSFWLELKKLAESPVQLAFVFGWATHVVLDEIGHRDWTFPVMLRFTHDLEDDYIHRKVEWSLARHSFSKLIEIPEIKIFLSHSPSFELTELVNEAFFELFGIKIDFAALYERMRKKLSSAIPVGFKLFFSQYLAKLLAVLGERKISAVFDELRLVPSDLLLAEKALQGAKRELTRSSFVTI